LDHGIFRALPEVAGMIVGQIVILIILLLVRREKLAEENKRG